LVETFEGMVVVEPALRGIGQGGAAGGAAGGADGGADGAADYLAPGVSAFQAAPAPPIEYEVARDVPLSQVRVRSLEEPGYQYVSTGEPVDAGAAYQYPAGFDHATGTVSVVVAANADAAVDEAASPYQYPAGFDHATGTVAASESVVVDSMAAAEGQTPLAAAAPNITTGSTTETSFASFAAASSILPAAGSAAQQTKQVAGDFTTFSI
jgi:hypothetical protein